jgi:hypothetical protein
MVHFDEEETPDIGSEAYLERIKGDTIPNPRDVRAICYYGHVECLKYLYEIKYEFNIGQEYILYMLKNDQYNSLQFAIQHHLPMPSSLLTDAIYFAAHKCVTYITHILEKNNQQIDKDSLEFASNIYFSDLSNFKYNLIEKRLKIVKLLYVNYFPNNGHFIIDILKNSYNSFPNGYKHVPEQLIQDPFWRSLLFAQDLQDDNEFDRQILSLKEQI